MKKTPSSPGSLRRWLDAFVALPERFKLPLAIVLALVVHFFVFVGVWVAPKIAAILHLTSLEPKKDATPTPISKPEELKPKKRTVYLTFEDGPIPSTVTVLDVLKRHGAHAAFFLSGPSSNSAPELKARGQIVQRQLAEAHELGNLGFLPVPVTQAEYASIYGDLSTPAQRDAFQANLMRNEEHFRTLLQQPAFKFSYSRLRGEGPAIPVLVEAVESLGLRHVAGDFVFAPATSGTPSTSGVLLKARDWQGLAGISASTAGLPQDGAIIQLRESDWSGANAEKLSAALQLLKDRNYAFGKLSEIKPKRQMEMVVIKPPVPKPPAPALAEPPPQPPPPAAPLTAAELAQLQKLFEQLPEEEQQEYIDVEGLARKKNLSKRALFESWRDSVAGSRKRTGTGPLPSQDGRTDINFTDFKNQQANSVQPKSIDDEGGAPGRPKPLPTVKFPGLEAPPIYRPRPVAKTDLVPNAKPSAPTAVVAPTPPPQPPAPEEARPGQPTPPKPEQPMQFVKLEDNEVPLVSMRSPLPRTVRQPLPEPPTPPLQPTPAPPTPKPPITKVQPTPPPKPTPAPVVAKTTPAPKPTPAPTPVVVAKMTPQEPPPTSAKDPASALNKEKRKIDGDGPEGEDGVDAIGTERGKYKRMMKLIVNSRWEPAVRGRMDLLMKGTVGVKFAIDAKGRLVRFKVDYNTSNNAHAMLVEEAMRATQFQPPVPELLRNGVFEDEFNFTIY